MLWLTFSCSVEVLVLYLAIVVLLQVLVPRLAGVLSYKCVSGMSDMRIALFIILSIVPILGFAQTEQDFVLPGTGETITMVWIEPGSFST